MLPYRLLPSTSTTSSKKPDTPHANDNTSSRTAHTPQKAVPMPQTIKANANRRLTTQGGTHFLMSPSQILYNSLKSLRITLLVNGLNSVIRANYANHVSHEKHENYANSDPQEDSLPCQWLSAKPMADSSASQFELFRHHYPTCS